MGSSRDNRVSGAAAIILIPSKLGSVRLVHQPLHSNVPRVHGAPKRSMKSQGDCKEGTACYDCAKIED